MWLAKEYVEHPYMRALPMKDGFTSSVRSRHSAGAFEAVKTWVEGGGDRRFNVVKYGERRWMERLMPSDVQEAAASSHMPQHSLDISFGPQFPLRRLIRLFLAPGNVPDRIDGGVLALRIASFSAGLARRYSICRAAHITYLR